MSVGGAACSLIVFLWQIPHFMAIAWLYRDDYGKAGFPLLPVIEPDGPPHRTPGGRVRGGARARPASFGILSASAGRLCSRGARAGRGAAVAGRSFAVTRSDRSARWLFFSSITYLPLIWIVDDGRQAVNGPQSSPPSTRRSTPFSTVLLVSGYVLIRGRHIDMHPPLA